jgi:DNA-binding PadR family transcriptional regulator
MVRNRSLSQPARTILAIMADARGAWFHGYDLSRRAGVKPGTLYPLLIRLEEQGHLEAQWQPSSERGRPPRHAYRLTESGRKLALENPPLERPLAALPHGKPA